MKTNNFLTFIEDDIEAKKTLIATMPVNNKRNIKKYNDKIDSIYSTYEAYLAGVKKYIDTKSKTLDIKESVKSLDNLENKIKSLEKVRFVLNPLNTFFEKMGFDNLLYQISNYSDFDFDDLNKIIEEFLLKFEVANVRFNKEDFNYTPYVNEYMTAFLEARKKEKGKYNAVAEIFEKIYWNNPEIIEHIELNFRKLIRKNSRSFMSYILKLGKDLMAENKIANYDDCQAKLKELYNELSEMSKEDVSDIMAASKEGTLDMSVYFNESKNKASVFESMMIDSSELDNKELMDKFYENLEKLKSNIEEYLKYNKFLPLVDDFKLEYEKQITPIGGPTTPTSPGGPNKSKPGVPNTNLARSAKSYEAQIMDYENRLDKINKKISGSKIPLLSNNKNGNEKLKLEAIKQAKSLYELYRLYDNQYFKEKIYSILSSTMTISELLHLYYSFDYFKKQAIKRVYNLGNYNELIKYSNSFDEFAIKPTNIIVNSIDVFSQNNISRVIMNKYRLANINLNDENLNPDELSTLLEKIEFMLRINLIEHSETTVEKIWFVTQVNSINKKENKSE